MNRLTAVLAIFLAITTAACGQAMKQPDIKLNPQPKMRYELTLSVHDAPGPFESVSGFMQYEVQNEQECVPADVISGHHQRLSIDPDIEFKRLGDSQTYKGTVYLDLVQDGDYYGLGVCRWKMVGLPPTRRTRLSGCKLSRTRGRYAARRLARSSRQLVTRQPLRRSTPARCATLMLV
jgi:hypothetical protein